MSWMIRRVSGVAAAFAAGCSLVAGGAFAEEPSTAQGAPAVVGNAPGGVAATVSAGPAFDRAFAARGPASEAPVGPAGKVVDRFAPPVAAPIAAAQEAQPFALSKGQLIRPCDTPGSGCRNATQVQQPPVVVPPIIPGTRPPQGGNGGT